MNRSYKLKELRKRLLEMTSNVNDESFSIPELNEALISAAAETIDHIITSGLSEQTLKFVDIVTTPGQAEYGLDSATYIQDKDFYKIEKVFVDYGNGQFPPIERINIGDILTYRPPTAAVNVRLYYIPLATNFKDADGLYNDEAVFEGINGWEEHTLVTAAQTISNKKGEDYSFFSRRKQELEERIGFVGNTDFSGPARVTRKRSRKDPYLYLPYQQLLSAWTLRGNKISFYYAYPWVP